MTSTSSAPFFSTMPIWMSPKQPTKLKILTCLKWSFHHFKLQISVKKKKGKKRITVLTHRGSSQCLSPNQLSRAKTIQEVTELGIWGQPHTREDETETLTKKKKKKHQVFIVRLEPDISYQMKFWIFRVYKSCWISFLIVRRAQVHVSLLSLGAVAVHASVCGLPAGLPSHPASHLHRQACLCAPLDSAAQLFTSRFWTQSYTHDTNDREGERRIVSPQHWTGGMRVARREPFARIITGVRTL